MQDKKKILLVEGYGISVATAVKSRILNPHTPTADKFVEWIKEVFVNP